ncbi:hypothetical protein LP417_35165 (plasmid) [Polaromonas sp. P1-6]|nr:hypothetical protein LP417_35165 [Polaromonas sp. P1-6]
MKKDYVITVGGGPGVRWLAHESDDDNGEPSKHPATTTDTAMALRSGNFSEIRKTVREIIKKYPAHAFRIDTLAPVAA